MRSFSLNQFQNLDPLRWLDYSLFHSLKRQFKPLQYIPRDSNFNPRLTSSQQSLRFIIKFTPSNRPYLPSQPNRFLISQLASLGFFDVFSTNHAYEPHGFGVYLSQVILFLEYGTLWVRSGFKLPADSMEIHHCSSNVLDNRPSNLEVVTKTVHSFLTHLQIGQPHSYSSFRDFHSPSNPVPTNKGSWLTSFNSVSSRLGQLIKKTLDSTVLWLKLNLSLSVSRSPDPFDLNPQPSPSFPNLLSSDAFYPLDDSYDKYLFSLSLNWLISKSIPDISTIYKNLKGAASTFLRSFFSNIHSLDIFNALIHAS